MAGITNSPFRRLMRRYGSSLVISELVSANGIEYVSQKTLGLLKFAEEERPVGLQIFGEDAERLARGAQVVEKLGADFVDLNLGCPVPKVVKKGAGSAMCRNPAELGKTLTAMVRAVKIPVTIKIRTGWDQQTRNAHEVVQAAYDAGVRWVAVHGRTRAQGYSGEADWDFIGEIKAKTKMPIIGNGDLNTPEIAVERIRRYGLDAVMMGRAILRNPFFFKQVSALWKGQSYARPTIEDYLELFKVQRSLMEDHFGRGDIATIHARKFLAWYASGFPRCHEFRKQVFTIPEGDVLWKTAADYFTQAFEDMRGRDMAFLNQPFLMGGHG